MKLYDFPFSPNCRKVNAVAYELGLELENLPVNLLRGESRTPVFKGVNPNARVPVLVDDDFVLTESNAIITYLAGKHPNGATLAPTAPRERAEVDRWLHWQTAHLSPAISKVAFERVVKKLANMGEPDQSAIDAGVAEFATLSGILDGALANREYVAGKLSVADFAITAHYSMAAMCGLDLKPFPRVEEWLTRMLARPSMKRAIDRAKLM